MGTLVVARLWVLGVVFFVAVVVQAQDVVGLPMLFALVRGDGHVEATARVALVPIRSAGDWTEIPGQEMEFVVAVQIVFAVVLVHY